LQVLCICQPAHLFRRDADEVLLHEAVKIFALLLVLFIFECWLRLDGGIRQPLNVAQFKSAWTILVILQGRLAEGVEKFGHGSILPQNKAPMLYFEKIFWSLKWVRIHR
jgi:hypothetical protein